MLMNWTSTKSVNIIRFSKVSLHKYFPYNMQSNKKVIYFSSAEIIIALNTILFPGFNILNLTWKDLKKNVVINSHFFISAQKSLLYYRFKVSLMRWIRGLSRYHNIQQIILKQWNVAFKYMKPNKHSSPKIH